MSTATWTNATGDKLWSTGGNWSGGSGAGGIPGAGQDILFNYGLPGTHDILGIVTGIAVGNITVTPGYAGTIGSDGNPVTFTNVTGTLNYAGNGAGARFGSSGTVTACVLGHTLGTFYAVSGTWSDIINTYGNLDIAAAAVLTAITNIGGTVTVGSNATGITTLITMGGTFTFLRNAATVKCKGGTCIQQDAGTATICKVTTAVEVEKAAFYNKQSSDTDTLVTVYSGGRFSLEKNTGGATGTVTITSTVVWVGASVKTAAMPGVTVTPNIAYKGQTPTALAI